MSTKQTAKELLALIEVEAFDLDLYLNKIQKYQSSLLEELGQYVLTHPTTRSAVSKIKELCNRWDSLAHRIENSTNHKDRLFPMVRGGFYIATLGSLKVSNDNERLVLRIFLTSYKELPYVGNKLVDMAVETAQTALAPRERFTELQRRALRARQLAEQGEYLESMKEYSALASLMQA